MLALHDQERAGLDIVTDGEMRRESYSNRFANALAGIDLDRPGTAVDRIGKEVPVPRVVGPIRRTRPVEADRITFLRQHTSRALKITLPGQFTMTQQAKNDYYPDDESLALAYAAAVNEEVRELFAAGVDFVQLDEPYVQARDEAARRYPRSIGRCRERQVRPCSTCASATRSTSRTSRPATRFFPSWTPRAPTRSRSRPPSPDSSSRSSSPFHPSGSTWACSTYATTRWRAPNLLQTESAPRTNTFRQRGEAARRWVARGRPRAGSHKTV